ncbi:serine hydrolase domain-containing protein [Dactylosporangium sp. NPDC005572]|uniref:serine hydrolase domain-containing protein n=1 Tax=Dactylosporangium sp. NPDC005572 TaxID=3156889 RepID=UPI0033B913EF
MSALDIVKTWPVDTAAVAVVDADGVRDRTGPDVALPWASVTKLLTALTVLVAVDRGDVTLDEPAGPAGSTVRHLLAHTSGIAFDEDQQLAAPGRKRVYSNRGFELLADFVLTRTGGTFPELMTESVLRPLGMGATRLAGSPAAGAVGPLSDLALLAEELLRPTLAQDLMPEATQVQFPGVSGVLPGFGRQDPNDWGLGFELRDGKSPHWTGARNSPATFGHFGKTGTFLWVDPVAGLALACLTDRNFGDWAAEAWPALSDAVLDEHHPAAG